jgi:hypothetical protein
MKTKPRVVLIVLVVSAGLFLAGSAHGQSAEAPKPAKPRLTCSPAPCVLPPTQASEGGGVTTDPLIVTDPLKPNDLLLGSVDYNCGQQSSLGFHLSTDGGSTWERVECMTPIIHGENRYLPDDEPSVGYDRKGAAYSAGVYFDYEGSCCKGFVAVQKSADGTHWSKPIVALRQPGLTYPFQTRLTVDANAGSSRVNSLYVSGVLSSDHGSRNQVLVSHSTDSGLTWTTAAVGPPQKYPEADAYTDMTVGKDGTIYLVWMYCNVGPYFCDNHKAHMMFSKSTDGGNTWSTPKLMITVTLLSTLLPHTRVGVSNYLVISVDNSSGAHAGNLYVVMYAWTGTYMRVGVIRSTDGGTTWSKPVYPAPKTDTHDQFLPSISVSPTGKVGVSWLDRRNDPADIDYQAFAAISTDGGQSFGANWQLTTAFSDPDNNGTQNNWMGDYTGNTWAGEDFIAAWMDSSNGVDMQEVVGGIRLK